MPGTRKSDEYKNVKSVHTFIWPFVIRGADKKDAVKKFINSLSHSKWESVDEHWKMADPDTFMLDNYLTRSARLIFGLPSNQLENQKEDKKNSPCKKKSRICAIFNYNLPEKCSYVIESGNASNRLSVSLPIHEISLHIYNHGIGILFVNALYKGNDEEDGKFIEIVKKINDFGRRIYLPFIPDSPDGFILCADRLGIRVDTDDKYVRNFRKEIEEENPENLAKPAAFLYALIDGEIGNNGKCLSEDKKSSFDIIPITDDRMFLMCLIKNKKLSDLIKDRYDRDSIHNELAQEIPEFEELNLEQLLYSIIYVDEGTPTCENEKLMDQLIEKSVYPRWSRLGTIYAVTNYSMLCITGVDNDNLFASVIRPYLIEYSYILSLVIAQRYGIKEFATKAGDKVNGVGKPGPINIKKTRELTTLQEEYVEFQNEILILEPSSQDQGIEIYNKIQDQLLIKGEQDLLDSQLDNLYEITNVNLGNRLQEIGFAIAIIAISADLSINALFSGDGMPYCCRLWLFLGGIVVTLIVIVVELIRSKK